MSDQTSKPDASRLVKLMAKLLALSEHKIHWPAWDQYSRDTERREQEYLKRFREAGRFVIKPPSATRTPLNPAPPTLADFIRRPEG